MQKNQRLILLVHLVDEYLMQLFNFFDQVLPRKYSNQFWVLWHLESHNFYLISCRRLFQWRLHQLIILYKGPAVIHRHLTVVGDYEQAIFSKIFPLIAFKVAAVQVLLEPMVILSLIHFHVWLTDFQANEEFVKVVNVDGVCAHVVEHHICFDWDIVCIKLIKVDQLWVNYSELAATDLLKDWPFDV